MRLSVRLPVTDNVCMHTCVLASSLVVLPPDLVIWVRALTGDIVAFLGKTLYSHSTSCHLGE